MARAFTTIPQTQQRSCTPNVHSSISALAPSFQGCFSKCPLLVLLVCSHIFNYHTATRVLGSVRSSHTRSDVDVPATYYLSLLCRWVARTRANKNPAYFGILSPLYHAAMRETVHSALGEARAQLRGAACAQRSCITCSLSGGPKSLSFLRQAAAQHLNVYVGSCST
jgi:hypothetical protein